jgi:DNA-binding NtrC family response regulator
MSDAEYGILVVDDERDICKALEFFLSKEGYRVSTASSGKEALDLLKKTGFDLVLTDLKMEVMDGIELLDRIKELYPTTIVVIMTAYASVESAVAAMKKEAADYIVKPFVHDDVKLTIKRLLEHRRLEVENLTLRQQLGRLARRDFIGSSHQIREIFETLEKVVFAKSNILLLGESGTGKGMIAEIIHYNSPRSERHFMSMNCSAIPETLLESELFGYKKGAFTGADSDKPGLIVVADGGTLFLDEIGDMPLGIQAKLLKFIETGEVLPLGDTKSRKIDVRIIAATNKEFEEEIKKGRFREDLFYRLNIIEIMIPPLRERKEDIPVLAEHFVEKYGKEHTKDIKGIDGEAMKLLMDYQWPGNARELSNVLERAVLLCSPDTITPGDLPDKIRRMDVHHGGLKEQLGYFERQLIIGRLTQFNWDKEETARELGIDLATLYRKMKKLGIDTGRGR